MSSSEVQAEEEDEEVDPDELEEVSFFRFLFDNARRIFPNAIFEQALTISLLASGCNCPR